MPRGTNSQGNNYDTRIDSSGNTGYRYSNTNGSCYYQNTNGSTYYNTGKPLSPTPLLKAADADVGSGDANHTSPSGQSTTYSAGSQASSDGKN